MKYDQRFFNSFETGGGSTSTTSDLHATSSFLLGSKRFYTETLKPIGYQILRQYGVPDISPTARAGFGEPPRIVFWIYQGAPTDTSVHIALRVGKRALVDAFYQAAIAAGGKDNGKPGIRTQYGPNYYGAFVLDPDGYNIEAVCRGRRRRHECVGGRPIAPTESILISCAAVIHVIKICSITSPRSP